MILKDKEVLSTLHAIETKLDIVIAMSKADKIRKASERVKHIIKGEKKDVK